MTEPVARHPETSRKFFYIRVTVLLFILAFVLLYAAYDVHQRRARNDWDHTLTIALVLVRRDAVGEAAISTFKSRVPALEEHLAAELRRYDPTAPRPFEIRLFGPIDVAEDAPVSAGDGLVDLITYEWQLWRYLRAIDERASVASRAFDSRIYVVARRPVSGEATFVEGSSEENGRIGMVSVDLDDSMADFALAVSAHELLHTLGASDKYDVTGRTLIPEGLAEPSLTPQLPQRFVEIMARKRPLGRGVEDLPASLEEVAVGPLTAREIRWIK